MIFPSVLLIVDAYLFLRERLTNILSENKVPLHGSDEEIKKAEVIVAMLCQFYDISWSVTHSLNRTTRDLLQYLSSFVTPDYCTSVSCC